MTALINEFVQYLIKFLAKLVCAFVGIIAGKKYHEKKKNQLTEEESAK